MKLFINVFLVFMVFPVSGATASGSVIRVATFNTENLFDLKYSGREYKEYIPGGEQLWNESSFKIKINNIADVIAGIDADIIALQEVESADAFKALVKALKKKGCNYPFYALARKGGSVVRCAVLSVFKITGTDELISGRMSRSVLRADFSIYGTPLTLYVNHWSSLRHPESRRIKEAGRLKLDIRSLPEGSEYIVLGDLNSFCGTSRRQKKNNNHKEKVTALRHILRAAMQLPYGGRISAAAKREDLLFDLWAEKKPGDRWSYIYSGRREALDHILIPITMADKKGIDYISGSFSVFKPDYLIRKGKIFRWQKNRKGVHLGKGYSDHLPLYAEFMLPNVKKQL